MAKANPEPDKKFVGTHLDEADYIELERIAKNNHRMLAQEIRVAISQHVDRQIAHA